MGKHLTGDADTGSWVGTDFAIERRGEQVIALFSRPMSEAGAAALEEAFGADPPRRYLHIASPRPDFSGPPDEGTLRLRLLRLLRRFRLQEGRMALVLEAEGFAAAAYHAFGTAVLGLVRIRAEWLTFASVDEAVMWMSDTDPDAAMTLLARVAGLRTQIDRRA